MNTLAQTHEQVDVLPVRELFPHPQRGLFPEIDELALEQLVADIAVRGILNPLIVTDKNVILSGHQRHRAALALEMATVPVIVKGGLSQAEELRYLIQDNLRRRHLTPSQRAVLGTSPDLSEVVDTIARDAQARRAQGGALAGRGRPEQLEATLPQAKRRQRKPQTRDIVADLVGVRGRLISDARFCWTNAKDDVEAIVRGESRATVSALAGQIRREQALAAAKESDSDIIGLILTPEVADSGGYLATFCGVSRFGKGIVVAWLVALGDTGRSALFLQRVKDERHPESGRLGRLTPLGATVSAIAESSAAEVDVRQFLGRKYRLIIACKGRTAKIIKVEPETATENQQSDKQETTVDAAPESVTKVKRKRATRSPAKVSAKSQTQRQNETGKVWP